MFHITFLKLNDLTKRTKWSRPTQSLPSMPLIGTNFLNAITLPTIGTYWNTSSQISGSATNTYSSQLTATLLHCTRRWSVAVGRALLVSVLGCPILLSASCGWP